MPKSGKRCGSAFVSETLECRHLLSSTSILAAASSMAAASNFVSIQNLLAREAADFVGHAAPARPVGSVSSTRVNAAAPPTANGLTGQYFQGATFQSLALTRTDAGVDFSWSNTPDPAIAAKPFSVRWTGRVVANLAGTYTFSVQGTDAVRLWVNGKLLIRDWKTHAFKTDAGKIKLRAGAIYNIRVECFQNGVTPGSIHLLWTTPGGVIQPIPGTSLITRSNLGDGTTPAAPTGLTATAASPTQVNLAWSEAAKVSTYIVQRSTDGIAFTTIGTVKAVRRSFADTSAAAGTLYYYEVSATKSADTSVPSNTAIGMTPVAAPNGLTAVPSSSTQIDLSWDETAGEQGFNVLASTDGGSNFALQGSSAIHSTIFHATGLTPSTGYMFEVVAMGVGGASAASAPVSATTPVMPALASPVASATSNSTTQAVVTWIAPPGATDYLIERSPNGVTNWVQAGTAAGTTQFVDGTVAVGTQYFYRVTASGPAGTSSPSNVVSVTTLTAAPQGLAAHSISAAQVDLTWNDVTSETGFIVERSPDGVSGWTQILTIAAGITHASDTGLSADTQYFYRVRAADAGGLSAPGGPVAVTTQGSIFSYVTDASAYSGIAGSTITVQIFSVESFSAASGSILLADQGYGGAGAGMGRQSGAAIITAISLNAAAGTGFDGGAGLSVKHISSDGSSANFAENVSLADSSGPAGVAIGTTVREQLLGTITILLPGVAGVTSTFTIGKNPVGAGTTVTFGNTFNLDANGVGQIAADSNAYSWTGAIAVSNTFTVTTT